MNEKVLNHPLITHKLAILRDVNTGTKEFMELNEKAYILPGLGDAADRIYGTK